MTREAEQTTTEKTAARKSVYFKDGRMYISRKAERRFYFLLTMLVLILGLLDRLRLLP